MNPNKFFTQFSIFAAMLIASFAFRGTVGAAVPTAVPTFNNPLEITSSYAPFQPGGVKVFQGSDGRKKVVVVHQYLLETRAFVFEGTNVASHILREMKFENGKLAKLSDNYLAQGDDGNVYSFGKSIINVTNGNVLDNAGSWLVGGPTSVDPAETATETEPSVFMLGNPEVGDVFKLEDFSTQPEPTARVTRTNAVAGTGLGRLTNIVRVVERREGQPATTVGYARELGLVSKRNSRESLRLISSSLIGVDLVIPTNNIGASPTNGVTNTNTVPVRPDFPETPAIPQLPSPQIPNVPATPTEPESPLNPDPDLPVDPGTPVDSELPVDPETPSDPEPPDDSETPTNPGNPNLPPLPPLPF